MGSLVPRTQQPSPPRRSGGRLARMTTASVLCRIGLVAGLTLPAHPATPAQQPAPPSERWVTAWGTSQSGLGADAVSNTTVRMIARVTISGQAVRIRLDNTFGTSPLV